MSGLTPKQSAEIRDAAARIRLADAETRTQLGLRPGEPVTLWDAIGEWAELGTSVWLLSQGHDFPRLEREILAARRMVDRVGETVAEMRRHGELTERAKRHGST